MNCAVKCNNNECNKRYSVETDSEQKPLLFCSQTCLNSYLSQSEEIDVNFDYDDPRQVRKLVQNLLGQTKQIQNELQSLKKIRKTYFGLFSDKDLKPEFYKRKWSFKDKASE